MLTCMDATPPEPGEKKPHILNSILRAIAARLLLYGGLCLAVTWYLAGPPWRWIHGSPLSLSRDEGRPADPGWPHIRGADYSGKSANTVLAEAWPADGPPVLWTRKIGAGYSGVIAVGNRVYAQTQTLTEQQIVALDADTGRTIWEHRYGWPYDPGGMFPGPRATPTWYDGRIYFASPDGLVGCLSAADGHELWTVDFKQKFEMRGIEFGYACSPLVEDGKVILPVGANSASVVALDAENGRILWASGNAPASYCSAMPITFRGIRLVVAFLQNELDGFDLKTGRLLWRRPYSHGYDEHAAMPLYEEPYLRTMLPFRAGSDLFRLEEAPHGGNAAGGSECQLAFVRHDPQMSNDVASSVLVDGVVYGFDIRGPQTSPRRPSRGTFRAIDFKSGDTLWSSDVLGQATIAVAGDKLLMLNDRGNLLLVRASPKGYHELARTEVFRDEACWTAPCLNRGRVYLRSPTTLTCLYVGPPEELERSRRESAVPASALAKNRLLDVAWLVGGERELPFEMPDFRELKRWYGFSLGAIASAWALAAAIYGLVWLACRSYARVAARVIFWTGLIAFGIVATPVGNHCCRGFVFTWPVALIAVHQLALAAVFWARQAQRDSARAWYGALGAGLLIVACLLYYDVSRRLALAPAWYFLPTFLVAWPLAVPAARRLTRPGSFAGDFIWIVLVSSVYFWASGGLMLWRASVHR